MFRTSLSVLSILLAALLGASALPAMQSKSKSDASGVCHQMASHADAIQNALDSSDYEAAVKHSAPLATAGQAFSAASKKVGEISAQIGSGLEDRDPYAVQEGLKSLRQELAVLHPVEPASGEASTVCLKLNHHLHGIERGLEDRDINLAVEHHKGLHGAVQEMDAVAATIEGKSREIKSGVDTMDVFKVEEAAKALQTALEQCHPDH